MTRHITSITGFTACGVAAGIKKDGKKDVLVIASEKKAVVASVFTQNALCAAPVTVSKTHAGNGIARAIVVNSGCANACTGEQGIRDAQRMAKITADALHVDPYDVLVASTGTIGTYLPMEAVADGIKKAVACLGTTPDGSYTEALMTTDTMPKEYVTETSVGGTTIAVGGVAKGAGMIHPNMATMLAFVLTDAAVSHEALRKALKHAVDHSFNMISVDADTSTNDMVAVLANGMAGNNVIAPDDDAYPAFEAALTDACIDLAKKIARDGEGATRLIEVAVSGAATQDDARAVARTVASSNLIKTAVFGKDPNWGRVMMCIGNSGAAVKSDAVDVFFEGDGHTECVTRHGVGAPHDARITTAILGSDVVRIIIDLNNGDAAATAWGCDMSYDYVKINATYTT